MSLAAVAELVDALDLGSSVPLDVEVRVLSAAQTLVFLRQMSLNQGSFGISSRLGQGLKRPQTTVKNRKEMYFLPDTEPDTELPSSTKQRSTLGERVAHFPINLVSCSQVRLW